jgi:hypothetical protein
LEFATVVTSGDAEKMKIAEEIVKECGGIAESDRCELGTKAGGCMKMLGMKKNIDFGF